MASPRVVPYDGEVNNAMQIFKTLNRGCVLLAALLSLSACAQGGRAIAGGRGGGGADPFSGGAAVERDIQLRVRNLNFNDARLYAISGASRRRLGEVRALQDKTFLIPWEFADRLRIEIDLVTGPRCTTSEIYVDPGEILDLQIESRIERTAFCR